MIYESAGVRLVQVGDTVYLTVGRLTDVALCGEDLPALIRLANAARGAEGITRAEVAACADVAVFCADADALAWRRLRRLAAKLVAILPELTDGA